MEDSKSLSAYLHLNEADIKIALVKDADIKILLPLQQLITVADEDNLVSFLSFMTGLDYTSISAQQNGLLDRVNLVAYGALINTAMARLQLLTPYRQNQHKNLALVLQSLVIPS
jgi:hypothetical protein